MKKLSNRWKEVEQEWWLEEAWDFCENIAIKAFQDWTRWVVSNQRQLPLPGEFKRYWWDNAAKYADPEAVKKEKGCKECANRGVLIAEQEVDGIIYEVCFRCRCNISDGGIPLWNEFKHIPQGYRLQQVLGSGIDSWDQKDEQLLKGVQFLVQNGLGKYIPQKVKDLTAFLFSKPVEMREPGQEG